MSKVTCVVCGHTEHGDSSYCMNPSCGELLPTAVRTAPSTVDAADPVDTADDPVTLDDPTAGDPAPPVEAPAVAAQRSRQVAATVSSARRWLLGGAAAIVLFGLAVAFSRGTARPADAGTSPEALPRAAQIAAKAPQVNDLTDDRFAVTIAFTDRSEGKAAFYVIGTPLGGKPSTMAEAARGATSVRVNAVNPEVEYCFVVVAILSVDEVAPSPQVCTARFGTPKS